MKARFENDTYKLYSDEDQIVGEMKLQPNFKSAEITLGEKTLSLSRDKWETKVFDEKDSIYHLQTNSFSGNTKILENERKITGVLGFEWATQMIDKENQAMLRMRNEHKFKSNHTYEIEITNESVSDLDIFLSLYIHLYSSSIKLNAVIMAVLAVVILATGMVFQ